MDFWYEFDLFFNPAFFDDPFTPIQQQTYESYLQESRLLGIWFQMRNDLPNYPQNFENYLKNSPDSENLINSVNFLANHQLRIINEKFDDNELLQKAFEDFGQGILYDDFLNEQTLTFRRPATDRVHIMAAVDYGYPRWHVFCRSVVLLENTNMETWLNIDRYIGLAHSLHKRLNPRQSGHDGANPNNPENNALVNELAPMFISAGFDQLDTHFDDSDARKLMRF